MLLKSSSTPVLGSLLSETTPKNKSESTIKHYSPSHCHYKRLPFASLNPTRPSLFSCTSSPISLNADFSDHDRRGFRRAQSEGNLNTLAHVSDAADIHEDPFYKPNKLTSRPKHSMLQSIPSFAFCNSRGRTEEDDTDVEEETEETWAENTPEEMAVKTSAGTESKMMGMILTRETTYKDETQQERESISQEMYLARGLGIDGAGGGSSGGHSGSGGGDFSWGDYGGEEHGMEEHYKKMVVENPGNPLVLRNYAQFLYRVKGDLRGAEEYYSRAILIDSADGEVLSQYAKLVWELHHDQLRASAYFKRAVQASPQDSHVHAAYANFLWETEDDADESCSIAGASMPPLFDQAYTAAATA